MNKDLEMFCIIQIIQISLLSLLEFHSLLSLPFYGKEDFHSEIHLWCLTEERVWNDMRLSMNEFSLSK